MLNEKDVRLAVSAFNDDVLVVFNDVVSLVSDTRQIDLDEIGIKVTELPEKAKKVWIVKIWPEEFVAKLVQYRTRIRHLAVRDCVMCNIGPVTSRERAVKRCIELDTVKAEFDDFIDSVTEETYEKICNDAVEFVSGDAKLQGFKEDQVLLLEAAVKDRQPFFDEFKNKIHLNYSVVLVTISEDDFDPILREQQRLGVVALRENFMGELIREICVTAGQIKHRLDEQYVKKTGVDVCVNAKTVKRAVALWKKVEDLSFVHQSLMIVAKEMGSIMMTLDSHSESLRGYDYENFYTLVHSLADQLRVTHCLENGLPLVEIVTPSAVNIRDDSDLDAQFCAPTNPKYVNIQKPMMFV